MPALLTFPLSLAQFIDQLLTRSITLQCPESVELSRTQGGELLTNELGARLWRGEVRLGRLTPQEADEAQTLIDLVRGAGHTFLIYDKRAPGPRDDPAGTVLGASTVQILELASDKRRMKLKGLPTGYTLRRGDKLSFDYGSNPTRIALHRIVDATVTANGLGETGYFEVVPPIRDGAAVDDTVRLVKPYAKVALVPGSVDPGKPERYITDGIAFSFIQTLR